MGKIDRREKSLCWDHLLPETRAGHGGQWMMKRFNDESASKDADVVFILAYASGGLARPAIYGDP